MPLSLGKLLSLSFAFWKSHCKPIIIASVVFATAFAVSQYVIIEQVQGQFSRVFAEMGVDDTELETLLLMMQKGDEEAIQEIMINMEGVMKRFEGMGEAEIDALITQLSGNFSFEILPVIIFGFLMLFVLIVLTSLSFLSLSIRGGQNAIVIAKGSLRFFFPIIGVWIWSFLRSFAWIGLLVIFLSSVSEIPRIIGIATTIILVLSFYPRLLFAPVILMKEEKGVVESVRLSIERSRGYWGKIVGNVLVMALCQILVALVAMIPLFAILTVSDVLAAWGGLTVEILLSAYTFIFITHLSITIMEHPHKTAS